MFETGSSKSIMVNKSRMALGTSPLMVVLGLVLPACSSLASFLRSRALNRRKEIAVRL